MNAANVKCKEDVIRLLKNKSEFERDILVATYDIPLGEVSTYKRVAEKIGRPSAYRASGNALHKNPLAPAVPCHRVVKSDGTIAGEKGSVESRRSLLVKEQIPVEGIKVKLSSEILY